MNVFGDTYAAAYDALYAEKNYTAEVDAIERIWKRYRDTPVHSVLDLGCGTGNHALLLAQRGYEVVGVDRAPAMLRIAEKKAQHYGYAIRWYEGDLRSFRLDQQFDATLLMFAVLGYLPTNEDLLQALRQIRDHLVEDGLLLFDIWYGPAVLVQRPSDRIREVRQGSQRILRLTHATMDTRHQICNIDFHLFHLDGDRVILETHEQHQMRYFFPQEIELLLAMGGFRLLRLGAFPDAEKEGDESSWNVMVIASPTS